jgi:4-hydroxybenzoate polyprenyltransferase
MSRGAKSFVSGPLFALGLFTVLGFFFTLRVLDEHKDQDLDRAWRPELPVPRGLVSLAELRLVSAVWLGTALVLNAAYDPRLLLPWILVVGWASLMTKEFFAVEWLRAHIGTYMVTHMLIMPTIDFYSASLDWLEAGQAPSPWLGIFLAVTFLNGVVLELGRKTRAPGKEREGVDTYSKAWGWRRTAWIWLGVFSLTALCAATAGWANGAGGVRAALLLTFYLLTAWQGLRFLRAPDEAGAKRLETASGLWTMAMYLWLGAGPQLYLWFH